MDRIKTFEGSPELDERVTRNFTNIDMDQIFNVRKNYKPPINTDEAEHKSRLTDRFFEIVFNHLKDKRHFDIKEMTMGEIGLLHSPVGIWDESLTIWTAPLFYTTLSEMIFFGSTYENGRLVPPTDYYLSKKSIRASYEAFKI